MSKVIGRHQHYWIATNIPHPLFFLTFRFRFDCSVCDKQIWRKDIPLNPIVPSAWEVYEKEKQLYGASMSLSPPIMVGSEHHWVEGERYKKLLAMERKS
jgi:hypothetical protein